MNKKEWLRELKLKYKDCKDIEYMFDLFLEEIMKTVRDKGELNLSGFGKFYQTHYKPRKYVDPRNGEQGVTSNRTTVRFRAGKPFRTSI